MRVVINDGFEIIWKILASTKDGGMTREELQECFGTDDLNRIKEFGFDVINENYQEWKRRKSEIHIGDEVVSVNTGDTFVVTRIKNDTISGFDGSGTLSSCLNGSLRKTGRSFPEVAVLLMDIKDETKGRASAAPKKPEDNFYGNDKTERSRSMEQNKDYCDKCRQHTENVIDDIEARIKNEIRELRENGEKHADFVQANAELIIAGLKSAMTIVEEVREGEHRDSAL